MENVGADDSKLSTSPFLSPFDAALSRPAELTPSSGAAAGVPKTAGSAPGGVGALSADAESGALGAGLPSCPLGGAPLASVRYTSGGLAITNSCPVPTLLPLGGEFLRASACQLCVSSGLACVLVCGSGGAAGPHHRTTLASLDPTVLFSASVALLTACRLGAQGCLQAQAFHEAQQRGADSAWHCTGVPRQARSLRLHTVAALPDVRGCLPPSCLLAVCPSIRTLAVLPVAACRPPLSAAAQLCPEPLLCRPP